MSTSRKLVIGVGVFLALLTGGALAFALIRESRDEDPRRSAERPTSETEPIEEASALEPPPQLPCNKREAKRALDRGALGKSVSEAAMPGELPSDLYEVLLIGCSDITGDGLDEMVMKVRWGTSSSPTPWAVLSQQGERWRAEFVREGVVTSGLKILADGVRERSVAYGLTDAFCCPSGERSGTVRFEDGEWVYRAKGAPKRLEITFADDGSPDELAGIPLDELNPELAHETFGKPSMITAQGDEVCTTTWNDLGLHINFVNLGMAAACGHAGRVGTLTLGGSEAQQAGWLIDGEALVGESKAELKQLYPRMYRSEYGIVYQGTDPYPGKPWALLERENPYAGGMTPSLEARIAGGKATAVDVAVGAAGD